MEKRQIKRAWKKFWWFIWEDDSAWSWVANIILAFVLIKFIVYPVLGFALGTTHPIVAVVSGSMEHDGSFDEWWISQAQCGTEVCVQGEYYSSIGISKEEFKEFRYRNGFNKGDIMILCGVEPDKIEVGDVLVFQSNRPDPIIHRVVNTWEENEVSYYTTKGDNNLMSIDTYAISETKIPEQKAIGYQKYGKASKAVVRVPFLGYIKIWAVELINIFR